MKIYVDESGSVNNKKDSKDNFIIALVKPTDEAELKRSYKRYISSHLTDLKTNSKDPGKMFISSKFHEIKGSALTKEQKKDFVNFFAGKNNFELFYMVLINNRLTDKFCSNTARVFNYSLNTMLHFLCKNKFLDLSETCCLHLDERNEKTETRSFLAEYLNTQFIGSPANPPFVVQYHDSANVELIQLADVFANLYYSDMITGKYGEEMTLLRDRGILRKVYQFPL